MKNILLFTTSLTTCSFLALGLGMGLGIGVAHANPEGGVVAAGQASIQTGVNRVDVHQSSDRAVIDWHSFNINKGETTQFHQPSSNSLTVNRINDANPSQILGTLSANGNVVLINQGGIMFGKDAVVDVNGLIATTSNISNANAMAGNMVFDMKGNGDSRIINEGTITAKQAGLVGLVAPHVENNGIINAKLGTVHLGSAEKFTVDLYGDGALVVAASDEMNKQLIVNTGKINAEGGVIQMTAAAGANLVSSLIQIEGELNTPQINAQGGKITIRGNDATAVSITGKLDASGTTGGQIAVSAKNIIQQGQLKADGTNGQGGQININFKNAYLDSETGKVSAKGTHGNGGTVNVIGDTDSRAFISGQYDTSSPTHKGGTINITTDNGDLKLYGAKVTADGKTQGGKVNIGGEYQGTGTLKHAKTTGINYATTISADATDNGKGGEIVVWSKDQTLFGGTAQARGGQNGGNGGLIEISSKDTMKIAGDATTTAAARKSGYLAGTLLLDPKNITIATGGIEGGGISYFELIDPNPDDGAFNVSTNILNNGNVVVTDSLDDLIATDSGAVYLFNGATGGLISTITGSQASDEIGYGGSVKLTNDNFVILSSKWNNATFIDSGAATWGSGTSGVSGVVSSSNSLVGDGDYFSVGTLAVALTNGNYVVNSPYWGDDSVGAVTWGNGLGGTTGVVSASNSLVGSSLNDSIGNFGVFALTNGNYVVNSSYWGDRVGAVTWGNGLGGTTGVVSASNSLVGSSLNDSIGSSGVYALTNGNYVVRSNLWDNGTIVDAGAVTWGNGLGGTVGTVNATNSLVGQAIDDSMLSSIVILPNGNYVINRPYWNNGVHNDVGAVTWGNGLGGTVGVASAANSLVGTRTNDKIGLNGIVVLTNGNYVVVSSAAWNNDSSILKAGAVTWGSGTTGVSGVVSATNSLVGSRTFDQVGTEVIALSNGNYVVGSMWWDNGASIANAGAVTWGNGTTGIVGTISAANSLVGSSANDYVSATQIVALSNGNYVVSSEHWDNGAIFNAGAVTWGNGLGGTVGTISAANSLVGTTTSDEVGAQGIVALTNGNYVFSSVNWDNGAIIDAGAVTWGNGLGGTVGIISAANSLVGTHANDMIGSYGVKALTNGNYVVTSPYWTSATNVGVGAVTWGNGLGGTVGAVSATNSLVGSSMNDAVGVSGVTVLSNGNYVVGSSAWAGVSGTAVGAATWGNGSGGTVGEVSAANSLIGSTDGDKVGSSVFALSNGNYIVRSDLWDNGAMSDAGAITLGNGLGGTVGSINSINSILGTVASTKWSAPLMDNVNNRAVVSNTTAQKVYSISMDVNPLGYYDSYGDLASSDVTLSPTFITNVLNAGTSVILQANNDITLNDDIIANNVSGDGGDLTLQAGRSILVNANIYSDNGNVYLLGNQKLSTGVVNAYRDAGNAVITMAGGTSINAGTGDVVIRLDDGAGLTNSGAGDVTLTGIIASNILVENVNATGDVVLGTGSNLIGTGTGTAITLVSNRDFINNGTTSSLSTPSGRWLVYSTDPADNALNGLTSDFRRFSCSYGASCPSFGLTGNGFLYSMTPMLTVTPDALPSAITAGSAVPSLGGYAYTLTGYLDSGDKSDDAVTGSLIGTTTYTTSSAVGTYNISYGSGTLLSALGYGFTYDDNLSAITVNAVPIVTPPVTPPSNLPDTVVYMSLGNYLKDLLSGNTEVKKEEKEHSDLPAETSFDVNNIPVTIDDSALYLGIHITRELRNLLDAAFVFE